MVLRFYQTLVTIMFYVLKETYANFQVHHFIFVTTRISVPSYILNALF